MKNAEMKVVRFSAEDVIATSGDVVTAGLWDGTRNNGSVTFGGVTYSASNNYSGLESAFNTAFNNTYNVTGIWKRSSSETNSTSLYEVVTNDATFAKTEDANTAWNGTWTWDSKTKTFSRIHQ